MTYAQVAIVFACLAIQRCASRSISLQVDSTSQGPPAGQLIGAGIEDVNHELYGGLYSQMVYGESFEEPARGDISGSDYAKLSTWAQWSSKGEFAISKDAFNGKQSQSIENGVIVNFGLGRQGLHFVAGHAYEGYLYAKTTGASSIKVSFVSLEGDFPYGLAEQDFQMNSSNWTRIDFSLVPQRNTTCGVSLAPRYQCYKTPELGSKACYQCSGAFLLEVTGSPALVDMVFLQPGEWGRFHGLPVRRDVAEAMFDTAGWQVVRLGGSMCNEPGYRWKNFRGPRELRQPYVGNWYPFQSGGFRFFEVLEMCEAADSWCAITINNDEQPKDMADFVEYCFGNSSTVWGKQRVNDGRLAPFKPFTIEIGNEQPLTMEFVHQVLGIANAMKEKADALGLSFPLRIAVGQNIDSRNFVGEGRNVTLAMVEGLKMFGEFAAWDAHIGGDNFADSDKFLQVLLAGQSLFSKNQSKMKMVVFEENGDTHGLQRALVHARMNIAASYHGDFFELDTAANGLQILGWNDNDWDQGQVFMTPDLVWLQPFGWSQWMLSQHKEFTIPLKITNTTSQGLDVGAYLSAKGDLGLRAVNWQADSVNCTIKVSWKSETTPTLEAYELHSDGLQDVNPPTTRRVEPKKVMRGQIVGDNEGFTIKFDFAPYSFVTMTLRSPEPPEPVFV